MQNIVIGKCSLLKVWNYYSKCLDSTPIRFNLKFPFFIYYYFLRGIQLRYFEFFPFKEALLFLKKNIQSFKLTRTCRLDYLVYKSKVLINQTNQYVLIFSFLLVSFFFNYANPILNVNILFCPYSHSEYILIWDYAFLVNINSFKTHFTLWLIFTTSQLYKITALGVATLCNLFFKIYKLYLKQIFNLLFLIYFSIVSFKHNKFCMCLIYSKTLVKTLFKPTYAWLIKIKLYISR